jgi:hypothetical protein
MFAGLCFFHRHVASLCHVLTSHRVATACGVQAASRLQALCTCRLLAVQPWLGHFCYMLCVLAGLGWIRPSSRRPGGLASTRA